jgi:hypothetical protein
MYFLRIANSVVFQAALQMPLSEEEKDNYCTALYLNKLQLIVARLGW